MLQQLLCEHAVIGFTNRSEERMSREDYRESVRRVESESVEETSLSWHHEGRNDYKNTYIDIEKIVDGDGNEYDPVWEEQPTEIFPGVVTRKKEHGTHVRIGREACPVRVLFREYFEYVSYDNWEHNSSSTTYWWVRYER